MQKNIEEEMEDMITKHVQRADRDTQILFNAFKT